ncbi:hypothetical protein [Snodgrassella gandavensis]|uniref:hypothetical protein n=1 Tax=Snodgrassella gandavensis TaxID=2946698 RepID=UPI001EF47C0F|nr:hypothetical protein [Snodgrassella gandavensis]
MQKRTYAENLVAKLDEVNTVIADKGYDSEPFRCFVRQKGGRTVIAKRNYGKDIDKSSMDTYELAKEEMK